MTKIRKTLQVKIVTAREAAAGGVDYSPRHGARCPWCNRRAKIYKTMKWEGSTRIRYHRCENNLCLLNQLGMTIKSVEEDLVPLVGEGK